MYISYIALFWKLGAKSQIEWPQLYIIKLYNLHLSYGETKKKKKNSPRTGEFSCFKEI